MNRDKNKGTLSRPVRWLTWIALRLTNEYDGHSFLDDLEIEFQDMISQRGRLPAIIWYVLHVLRAVPELLFGLIYWRITMFRNYMKIAFRNLKKHKAYTLINIAGMATGMTVTLFIFSYVSHEMSYDRFHHEAENIYQIITHVDSKEYSITPTPLATKLKEDFPEVMDAVRYHWIWGGTMLSYSDVSFNENGLRLVDSHFFNLFNFEFVKGDPEKALENPNSIVITQDIAEKYFGHEDPIGKLLSLNREHGLTVTGLIKNIPSNSSIRFDMLVPIHFNVENIVDEERYITWDNIIVNTFVKCRPQTDIKNLAHKIDHLAAQHTSRPQYYSFSSVPLVERYFYFYTEKSNVTIFSTVAIFILLIACFNFMNLSMALSIRRTKEIGLRKVVGAMKKQIGVQFLGESLFLAFIAGVLAWLLFMMLHPTFKLIGGKEIEISNVVLVMPIICISLVTGLLAGIYPALILSRIRSVFALAGKLRSSTKSRGLRSAVVVIQFVLSIFLLIGMLVVQQQKKFMQTKDVGYEKEYLLAVPMDGGSSQYYQVYKDELLKESGIIGVTGTAVAFPFFHMSQGGLQWEGKAPDDKNPIDFNMVDYDFVETLQIDLSSGRAFSRQYISDKNYGLLINEAMATKMGIDPIIGARVDFPWKECTVIGVFENFHFSPLDNSIEPLVLMLNPDQVDNVLIRVHPEHVASTIIFLEEVWDSTVPDYPFEYSFLNEEFDESLFSIGRTGNLLKVFSALAILISCLGLIGLSSQITEQRTKEIGIRKVLGASGYGIVGNILKEFATLVLIANIIVWPVAYFAMDRWLQAFAYHVRIGLWIFLVAGLSALFISLMSISWQTICAARANPVKALKHE